MKRSKFRDAYFIEIKSLTCHTNHKYIAECFARRLIIFQPRILSSFTNNWDKSADREHTEIKDIIHLDLFYFFISAENVFRMNVFAKNWNSALPTSHEDCAEETRSRTVKEGQTRFMSDLLRMIRKVCLHQSQ